MTRLLSPLVPAALVSWYAPASLAQSLEPPPPMAPAAPPGSPPGSPASSSAPKNSDDESEDSGLGLEWVWLNPDIGVSPGNMPSFTSSQLGLGKTPGTRLTVAGGPGDPHPSLT